MRAAASDRRMSLVQLPNILGQHSLIAVSTRMPFSENVRQVEASATIAIANRARELRSQGRDVLDLGIGEPDFRTPEFVAQAGIAAIQDGHTHYPPVPGIAP